MVVEHVATDDDHSEGVPLPFGDFRLARTFEALCKDTYEFSLKLKPLRPEDRPWNIVVTQAQHDALRAGVHTDLWSNDERVGPGGAVAIFRGMAMYIREVQ